MPTYRVNIPTFKERHKRELWWVADDVSTGTLYQTGGSWYFERSPNNTTLVEADKYYRGGYENFVTDEDVVTLTAAGFGDWLDPVDVFSDEFSDEFS